MYSFATVKGDKKFVGNRLHDLYVVDVSGTRTRHRENNDFLISRLPHFDGNTRTLCHHPFSDVKSTVFVFGAHIHGGPLMYQSITTYVPPRIRVHVVVDYLKVVAITVRSYLNIFIIVFKW